jgi:hypothetical protein
MRLPGNFSNKSLLIVNLEKSQISAAFATKAAGQWRPCLYKRRKKTARVSVWSIVRKLSMDLKA